MPKKRKIIGVFTTKEGRQWFAEVIENEGEDDEVVIYTTGFYPTEEDATVDAEQWIKDRRKKK